MAVAIFDHQPSPDELLSAESIEAGGPRRRRHATETSSWVTPHAAFRIDQPESICSSGRPADRELPRQDDHVLGRDR